MIQKTLDGSCSLSSRFLLWKKEASPSYTDNLSEVFSNEFHNVVVLTRQLRNVSNQDDEEVLFIRAIIAMEFVLSTAREVGIEVPNIPPPIEGFEELYNIMKVMKT